MGHHLRARRISLRLRHRRHLRRGADDSGALGPEPGHARARDGRGALWHRARFADRRAGRRIASGRKPTLLWIGVLYIVSAVGCGYGVGCLCRSSPRGFIGGIGIGISTVAAPLYISEIAPPAHRGRLAGMFQFNIVFGIVVAFALERAARRHRRKRVALDARRRGVSIDRLHADVLRHPGKSALAAHAERRPRRGAESARASSSPARIAPRDRGGGG